MRCEPEIGERILRRLAGVRRSRGRISRPFERGALPLDPVELVAAGGNQIRATRCCLRIPLRKVGEPQSGEKLNMHDARAWVGPRRKSTELARWFRQNSGILLTRDPCLTNLNPPSQSPDGRLALLILNSDPSRSSPEQFHVGICREQNQGS